MNIIYISGSKIPSKTANSIHVMKMCEAFANQGITVSLIAKDYRLNSENMSDIYEFYNVSDNFKIKLINNRIQFFNGIYYALKSLSFLFKNRNSKICTNKIWRKVITTNTT